MQSQYLIPILRYKEKTFEIPRKNIWDTKKKCMRYKKKIWDTKNKHIRNKKNIWDTKKMRYKKTCEVKKRDAIQKKYEIQRK